MRDSLVADVLRSPASTIVIAAPAGCGKSVLAAQIADSQAFDIACWVDCSWVTDGAAQLSSAVCSALDRRIPLEMLGDAETILPDSRRETWADALERLESCAAKRACVVLDSLNVPIEWQEIAPLRLAVSQVMDPSSRLLITTRSPCDGLEVPSGLHLVGPEALCMSLAEVEQLAKLYGGPTLSSAAIGDIHGLCGGQAALSSVMIRHAQAEGGLPSSTRVSAAQMTHMLCRMIRAQLDPSQIGLLYLCALVQSGSVADVRPYAGKGAEAALCTLARTMPLFRLQGGGTSAVFSTHDILGSLVLERIEELGCSDTASILDDALHLLEASGRVERIYALIEAAGDKGLARTWLLRRGRDLLAVGGVLAIERVLRLLTVADVIREPDLLLLEARMLREKGDYAAALKKAVVAEELASHEGRAMLHDTKIMQARLLMDLGRLDAAADCLQGALDAGVPRERLGGLGLLHSYLAFCRMMTAQMPLALAHQEAAFAELGRAGNDEIRARIMMGATAIEGVGRGRWDLAVSFVRQTLAVSDLPLSCRLQLLGNHSHALMELGDTKRAREAAEGVIRRYQECEAGHLLAAYSTNLAACSAADGEYADANRVADEAGTALVEMGDLYSACICLAFQSAWCLAERDCERALSTAEQGLELAMDSQRGNLTTHARLQMATALLAVGDYSAALNLAETVIAQASADGSLNMLLAADLVGAECARRQGVDDRERPWSEHGEYITTGSMNWRLSMLIRAFPGMLVTLVEHGLADTLPRRLLKLLFVEHWEAVIALSGRYRPEIVALMRRAGLEPSSSAPAPLQVQLFGGLDVNLNGRTVGKRDWRKRKARLMFAMLVLEQGNELPRDRIAEHLWPEVDAERATNNFYVAWSAMKAAILPGADKTTKLPYLENSHGLCRAIMTSIDADVTEFASLVVKVRAAREGGDAPELSSACERLAEIYRGELLPGDLYDDWFVNARDKYRRQFGDAMLSGAEALLEEQDFDRAVFLLRRGVEADPWREGLYQVLLRAHIAARQRSAAIDTYLSCRARLAEELGLDPSAETVRLYEQVLAMEECDDPYGEDAADAPHSGENQ